MEKVEKRNIVLTAAGVLVSKLGSLIYTFAIGLYVLKVTGSGQSFSITLLLGILPQVLLGPFAGNLSDRLNKKALIVGADFFSGVLMIGLYLYTIKGELTIPIIYGSEFLLAVSSVLLGNAFSAAQRDIVRIESLTKLGSIRQSIESITNLVSPLIGGLVYVLFPIKIFILFNGISFILSSASEYLIDFNFNKSKIEENDKQNFFSDMKSGFSYFKKDRLIVGISLSALMINFFLSAISIILPVAIVEKRGISEQLYGLSSSVVFLGALAGAIIVGKKNILLSRKIFIRALASVALFSILAGVAMHSVFGGSYLSLAMITVFGFMELVSVTFVNVPIGVFFQTRVAPAYLGRVSSIIGSMCHAVMPVAYILYGLLSEHFSPFIILTVSGLLNLILILIMAALPVFKDLDA